MTIKNWDRKDIEVVIQLSADDVKNILTDMGDADMADIIIEALLDRSKVVRMIVDWNDRVQAELEEKDDEK